MSIVTNIGSLHSSFPAPKPVSAGRASPISDELRRAEPVAYSKFGPAFSLGIDESSFRIARIQSIRAEIGGGTFETQARIEGTVSRLLNELA